MPFEERIFEDDGIWVPLRSPLSNYYRCIRVPRLWNRSTSNGCQCSSIETNDLLTNIENRVDSLQQSLEVQISILRTHKIQLRRVEDFLEKLVKLDEKIDFHFSHGSESSFVIDEIVEEEGLNTGPFQAGGQITSDIISESLSETLAGVETIQADKRTNSDYSDDVGVFEVDGTGTSAAPMENQANMVEGIGNIEEQDEKNTENDSCDGSAKHDWTWSDETGI